MGVHTLHGTEFITIPHLLRRSQGREYFPSGKRALYQPAGHQQTINKLEDSLNTVLFTRNSRGVQLTDEGQVLFEHTRDAFEELAKGEQELKRIREFNMGHIRIGVSNTLCRFIMVKYLKGFIEQYPHIKITIESQPTTQTLSMLEQQRIDTDWW